MIRGIGVDMVQINRASEKHAKLAKRVLTPNEYLIYQSLDENKQAEFFAGRFAIKEAYYKALGNNSIGYQDVDISYDENGRPCVQDPLVHISLTHDGAYALAFVVIEKK